MKLLNRSLMIEANSLELISNLQWMGTGKELRRYDVIDGKAIIYVHGLLTKRSDTFGLETTSYEEISTQLTEALSDIEVREIVLDIDSPGGEVSGLFDIVDYIYASRSKKPIYAHVNDSACSAAYAIASGASKIFVTRTSMVGSIGVIAIHSEVSEAEKKAGIKYTTVYAGAKKNDLSPHSPITDEAIADLQEEVDRIYQIFVETVGRNRNISEEVIRGTEAGVFYGEKALKMNLADELIYAPFGIGGMEIGNVKKEGEQMEPKIEATIEEKEVVKEEKQENDLEKYKAEILEISKLCKLAHAEHKITDFIIQGLRPKQVKEKLLDSMDSQEKIASSIYPKSDKIENPVIAAAKQRAQVRK